MRLADFIQTHNRQIVDGAEAFAATQAPHAMRVDSAALRDHLPQILDAIMLDLRTTQNADQQHLKSEGNAPPTTGPESAASTHGRLRAKSGFNIEQMVAEYRALRAAVLRLWVADAALDHDAVEDLIRFNEAIDQAVAESVANFAAEAQSWREVFLGVLGHDLRGPLNVIVTTSELLSRMAGDTPYSQHTERIIQSGKRMNRLLDDLLEHSRVSLGMGIQISPVDCELEAAVDEELDLLRAAWPGVKIRFRSRGPVRGPFDASRIREALNNLVTNAVKYGDSGREIVVTLAGDAQAVELAVCNSGAMLESSSLPGLFEPLQRGTAAAFHDEHASLGLGLFVVRQITKAHGGEVTAHSSDGANTFTMRLPREP